MIGILGLANNTTLYYIKRLNQKYNTIHGGYSTCPFVLRNIDFNLINPFLPNDFTTLIPRVKKEVEALNNYNVSKILIPNITLHQTIDKIDFDAKIREKIIHPLYTIDKEITSKDYVLIGSKYTMRSNYISSHVTAKQYELSDNEMLSIDTIRKEIDAEGACKAHMKVFEKFVVAFKSKTLLIACTEHSLLYSHIPKFSNVIDLVERQISSCFNKI